MSKKTRTLGVDDFIRDTLKEPDRYTTDATDVIHTPAAEEDFNDSTLFHMTDANLEGRVVFYEKEAAFARSQTAKSEARTEIGRTQAEIARRKAVKRTDAVIDALVAPMGRPTPETVLEAEAAWQRVTKIAA